MATKSATAKTQATTRKATTRKATPRAAPRKGAAETERKSAARPKPRSGTKRPTASARGAARRPRNGSEQPNLEELTRLLRERVTSRVPSDYVRGKTRLRDEVMSLLSCSSARAEHIVDSMVARGYARFGRHPRFTTDPRFGIWHLDDSP